MQQGELTEEAAQVLGSGCDRDQCQQDLFIVNHGRDLDKKEVNIMSHPLVVYRGTAQQGSGLGVHAGAQVQGFRASNSTRQPGCLLHSSNAQWTRFSQHLPCDLKQEATFAQRRKPTPTYPNLPFQGRDDLSHHAYQVLVFIRVVCEPHRLSNGQNLFADEPGM